MILRSFQDLCLTGIAWNQFVKVEICKSRLFTQINTCDPKPLQNRGFHKRPVFQITSQPFLRIYIDAFHRNGIQTQNLSFPSYLLHSVSLTRSQSLVLRSSFNLDLVFESDQEVMCGIRIANSAEKYAWLNDIVCIGRASTFGAGKLVYDIFEVL